jgi:GLPGLI family protein
LYSDNDAANLAIIKLSFLGNILIKNDSVTKEGKSRTIGNYLVSRKLNKDWKLVNETKLIDKYTCYKATTIEVVQNPKGNFEKDIIAWYCPELPFSFGPLGYGGLPGLILELQTEDGVFGAKELKLIETDIEIQNLKNYKTYSETELNKLIEEKNSTKSK